MPGRYVLWVLLFCCCCQPLAAAEVELLALPPAAGGPWYLKADRVQYQTQTRTYEAWGRVEIRQGDRRLQADYIKVEATTKIATLVGNVVLVAGEDIFTGKEGVFNLVTRAGEIRQARLFLRRNRFHLRASLIRQTGEDTYYAEDCVITTCDADRPAWSFTSREVEVKVDGYALGGRSTFRLGGIPVLYLPVTVLPVKTTRQSGFLLPSFSQHRAGGTVVELPFYWAINRQMDLTLYQQVAKRQGYLQGVEYRFASGATSGGLLRWSYIHDYKEYAPTPHRYWAVGMLNQRLPGDWELRGTLDIPSDRRYLYDFNYGYLGLDRLSRVLAEEYGRNLEQFEVNTRVSGLLLGRNFSWGACNLFGRYYRPLTPESGRPFHKAPAWELATLRLPVGSWPLFLTLEQTYTHYYRPVGLSGHRLDFHPQLTATLAPGGLMQLEVRAGWRGTGYRVDSRESNEELARYLGRSLYDIRASIKTAIYRDWGGQTPGGGIIRHVLEPRLTYYNYESFRVNRIPHFDPWDYGWQIRMTKNYPILDGTEPIGGVDALTCAITNHILQRTATAGGPAEVRDLLWLRLSQSIFFNSASYGLDGTLIPHRRLSDFILESRFFLRRNLALGADLGLSPYREGFNRLDLSLLVHDRGFRNYFNIDYSYLKDYANQISAELFLSPFRSLKVGVSNQHTFVTGKRLENRYNLIFQQQCWGLRLTVADREYDRYVGISLIIPGFLEKQPEALERRAAVM